MVNLIPPLHHNLLDSRYRLFAPLSLPNRNKFLSFQFRHSLSSGKTEAIIKQITDQHRDGRLMGFLQKDFDSLLCLWKERSDDLHVSVNVMTRVGSVALPAPRSEFPLRYGSFHLGGLSGDKDFKGRLKSRSGLKSLPDPFLSTP
jgi:hypothetical protein